MSAPSTPRDRITRDQLEDKFRELEGGAREQAEAAKGPAIAGGVGLALLLLLVAFLLGTRKGRKRSTVVEIRRI